MRENCLQLTTHLNSADALKVFRRKLPGATATATTVHHPFWWVSIQLRVTTLLSSGSGRPARTPQVIHVLVNATSGSAFIADFTPEGTPVDYERWAELLTETVPPVSADRATAAARTLVRTRVLKTVKLGMRVDTVETSDAVAVLKTNWLVNGENTQHAATILVDGFDSSHYVVRVRRR